MESVTQSAVNDRSSPPVAEGAERQLSQGWGNRIPLTHLIFVRQPLTLATHFVHTMCQVATEATQNTKSRKNNSGKIPASQLGETFECRLRLVLLVEQPGLGELGFRVEQLVPDHHLDNAFCKDDR